MSRESVLVLDFGAQYSQLIARRIRECAVFSEILPYDVSIEEIKKRNPKGIILSGGPSSVYDFDAPSVDPGLFDLGVPILGICYGFQLMIHTLGGQVKQSAIREYGKTKTKLSDSPLFHDCGEEITTWMSHGDSVSTLAPNFEVIGHTDKAVAAAASSCQRFFGVQFHPEVVHTERGGTIISNFLLRVCKCQADWTMESFATRAIEKIRAQIPDQSAICGMSGGIDSAVAAVLVHKAIGARLNCIYVDHGFMRKHETKEVVETFRDGFQMSLVAVDARSRFQDTITGVRDPEQKRKAIGAEFIRVFEEEAARFGDAQFLVQGTLYPDVIESGTKSAAVIKSHHNVGGLPEDMQLELVEPLRDLFKDEVRKLARELGLPEEIVGRHPFPGPGLAIRVMGEITKEKLDLLRDVDAIYLEELRKHGLYDAIWQAFAVLTNTQTVGVMGDKRTYEYVVALRAVTSTDGMTADWAVIPPDVLGIISNRIMNEVSGVNRVVYDISSKPPATIEWE